MKPRPVVSLNEQGEVIKEYRSAREAAWKIYLHPRTVTDICHGRIKKNRNGFILKWKEDFDENSKP